MAKKYTNRIRKPEMDSKTNFTMIPNDIFEQNISAKATGFYLLMYSKPDNWIYHPRDLIKDFTDGIDTCKSAIRELIEAKLIERIILRDEKGRIIGNDIIFLEFPTKNKKFINNIGEK